jgi:membrane fusion protein, multidrug efflux system
LGEAFGLNRVIEKGLKPGDHVVVEGVQKVRDGIEVNPHPVAPFQPSTKPAAMGQGD